MKSVSTPVYWDTLRHQDSTFHLAATDDGLCCVTLPNETLDTLSDWLDKHVPGAVRTHHRDQMAPYVEQMKAYLDGRTQAFSVPLDFRGTPFQIRVWRGLLEIPFGSIRSYTDLAASIGHPAAVRAVAAACGANPMPIVVPCHRVIGKDGRLTGYRGGLEMKAKLLRMEGIAPGLTITVDENPYTVNRGDAIRFRADVPHVYHNAGNALVRLNMVIYYPK